MEKSNELRDLIDCVNYFRYRGVDSSGPMHSGYYWPMQWNHYEAIARAALKFVVSLEQANAEQRPHPTQARMADADAGGLGAEKTNRQTAANAE